VLRLVGFFAAVLLALALLRHVPVIGGIFHGLVGFWLVAIAAALAASKLTAVALERRGLDQQVRALGHVASPHNQGKLGSLYASRGRFARALPHLDQACAGEPDVAEWHYRRGTALLALGRAREAVEALQRAEEIDPRHGYGAIQVTLARALAAHGRGQAALGALDRFDLDHGPAPESAYWRGVVLKKLGRVPAARASLRRVAELAAIAPRYRRRENRAWIWRAWLARLT
jgi:hypothetical protein